MHSMMVEYRLYVKDGITKCYYEGVQESSCKYKAWSLNKKPLRDKVVEIEDEQ